MQAVSAPHWGSPQGNVPLVVECDRILDFAFGVDLKRPGRVPSLGTDRSPPLPPGLAFDYGYGATHTASSQFSIGMLLMCYPN